MLRDKGIFAATAAALHLLLVQKGGKLPHSSGIYWRLELQQAERTDNLNSESVYTFINDVNFSKPELVYDTY